MQDIKKMDIREMYPDNGYIKGRIYGKWNRIKDIKKAGYPALKNG